MENNYWHELWQKKDIPFNQEEVNADLMAYSNKLALKPGDHILVPLCGKSIDMLWLLKQGYKVTGVELSPTACQEFFSENNLTVNIITRGKFKCYQGENIELLCGDFFDLVLTDLSTIDAVYDRAALIALPIDLRTKYAEHLTSFLRKNTAILLLAIESLDAAKGPPFSVNNAEVNMLFNKHFQITLLKRESRADLAPHLIEKGYMEIINTVFLLIRATNATRASLIHSQE